MPTPMTTLQQFSIIEPQPAANNENQFVSSQYISSAIADVHARNHIMENIGNVRIQVQSPKDVWMIPGMLDTLYRFSPQGAIDMDIVRLLELCFSTFVIMARDGIDADTAVLKYVGKYALTFPLAIQKAVVAYFQHVMVMMTMVMVEDAKARNSTAFLKNFISAFMPDTIGPVGPGNSKKDIAQMLLHGHDNVPDALLSDFDTWVDDGNAHDYNGRFIVME